MQRAPLPLLLTLLTASCGDDDHGAELDAGSGMDAGAPVDAATPADAGPPRDAGPGAVATWTEICDNGTTSCTPGPEWSTVRGFINVLPYDAARGELLYLGAGLTDTSIYSNAIWGYVPTRGGVAGHMVLRVDSMVAGTQYRNDCPNYAPVDATYPPALPEALTAAPLAGHPNGNAAFDTMRGKLYLGGWLCNGQFEPRTHVYDSATARIDRTVDANEYPTCVWSDAPPHECDPGRNFQSWAYMRGVDRVLIGLSDANSSRRMVELDPTTLTYCVIGNTCSGPDVTAADGSACAADTCPPPVFTAYSLAANELDGMLYVYGGCAGSTPGNGVLNACNGTPQNDLWRYDPAMRRFTRLVPADDVKPPAATSSSPLFALDVTRNRFLLYAGTDDLWAFDLASATWTQLTATNPGPVYSPLIAEGSNGLLAGYDPLSDTFVVFLGGPNGQAASPTIWEARFGAAR